MTLRLRYRLAFVPLGLALAGCGGPDQHASSSRERLQPSARLGVDAPPVDGIRRDAGADARLARFQEGAPQAATESRYDISLREIRGHQANHTAVLIDAREPSAFEQAHLRGATNIPSSQKENYTGRIRQDVATSQFIVIYC